MSTIQSHATGTLAAAMPAGGSAATPAARATPAPATPTARAPRRDAALNRAALLEAAAATLRSDPDASLEAIAAAAGLTRRSVYGHFANRDELVNAVVIAGAERVAAAIGAVRHEDPLTTIALIGDVLWTEVDHVRVMAPLAVRGPLRAVTAAALEPVRTLLRDTVEAGIARGSIRTDIAPDTLARLIESAAVAVLEEATRAELSTDAGRRLVMLTTLSVAGLSWRDADELAEATDRITKTRQAHPHAPTTRTTGTGHTGPTNIGTTEGQERTDAR
ncbi:TetR/AcrR family transcriptional regulator [Plantibacter sp. YIM 135347]|uniref:TetR/AcrR family transcriptional regulator n=1 Tax=Plantibacter sp. YIM 135347 TaxID=3423919 RepID=UPI003D35659E